LAAQPRLGLWSQRILGVLLIVLIVLLLMGRI